MTSKTHFSWKKRTLAAALFVSLVSAPFSAIGRSLQEKDGSSHRIKHTLINSKPSSSSLINAHAYFNKVDPIAVDYSMESRVSQASADGEQRFAQVAIKVSNRSHPLTLNCDVESTSIDQNTTGTARNVTRKPCPDISEQSASKLLENDNLYLRRIPIRSDENSAESMQSNDVLVISFSYL